jgi:hypothetical protein
MCSLHRWSFVFLILEQLQRSVDKITVPILGQAQVVEKVPENASLMHSGGHYQAGTMNGNELLHA